MIVRPLSTVDNTRDYARVSHSRQWSNYNVVVTGCNLVYIHVQTQPVVTLEPNSGYLYAASWSPTRPLVIAIATGSGKLLLYDLNHTSSAPVLQLDASTAQCPVYTLAFNPRQ